MINRIRQKLLALRFGTVEVLCQINTGERQITINFAESSAENFHNLLASEISTNKYQACKPEVRFLVNRELLQNPYVAFRIIVDRGIWQTDSKPYLLLENACLIIVRGNRANLIVSDGNGGEIQVDRMTLLNPRYFVEEPKDY